MIRKIILILVPLILTMPVFAQKHLTAGIDKTWTVHTAREEVFNGANEWVDVSKFAPYDPYIIENKEAINRGQLKLSNRIITIFDKGYYAIMYYSKPNETQYFFNDGSLVAVEFTPSLEYPRKSYKYLYPNGQLTTLSINVEQGNTYIFETSGKLNVHWIGNKCYDINGNIIMMRRNEEGNSL